MSVQAFLEDVIRGGLPQALDYGDNTPNPAGNRTQFTERQKPVDTGGVSPEGVPPVNWLLWAGVATAAVLAVVVLVKR